MHKISQSIRIKVPCAGLFYPNQAEFGRIWQNLVDIVDITDIADIADIIDIADIADITVGTGPYLPPPNYIIAKYLKKNPLSLL
jgi:hypothetical protein